MFKSIRWRFVVIYFLLVFLAMSIVGVFIISQLENIQLENNSKNMIARAKSILATSTELQESKWSSNITNIQNSINNNIQIGYNENVYVILNDDKRTIIASSVNETIGQSAYNSSRISNYLLEEATKGTYKEIVPKQEYEYEEDRSSHLVYPVKYSNGEIQGYIYLTNDINFIYDTVNQSKDMLTQGTFIALFITVLLGLILSRSITGPIKDLTIKAKKMSEGDFNQKVDVKSEDEIGQLGRMFNYLIDELKVSISKLQQEKSKIETTFEYMQDGVLTIDTKGDIIHINPVARKILSMKDRDQYYDQIISRKTHELYLEKIKENDWNGTYILQSSEQTYKIDYAPFKDAKDDVGGVILVFKNITEQFKLEKMQKEFVANVSHELKTPITTIKSYTETLLDGALEDKETAVDFLNVINSESDRMSRLVSDLLRLSRMEFEQTNWVKEKLSINEILNDVYRKLVLTAKNKQIKMSINMPKDNLEVLFDKDGLEQILLNVVGNAIKYTQENGNVDMSLTEENERVFVSIKDNGIGIPKEDLPRIFDRFYRVDKARTRQMGGTGLGLSIAKRIAEAHDSIIEVESKPQLGTLVRLIIPKY